MSKYALLSVLIVFALIQISCNNGAENVSENTKTNTTNKKITGENFSGTFSGTTPCADCPGIKTTIIFNPDSTFIESLEYLERNTSFSDTGSWRISDKIITVAFPAKNSSTDRFYAIKSDSTIAMLDGDKKEIEGALAKYYVLKKMNFGMD